MANHSSKIKDPVMVSKRELEQLKKQAHAYRSLAAGVFDLPLNDSVAEVVADFRATSLYSSEFLSDLEAGLHKSSYGKRYDNKATAKRS